MRKMSLCLLLVAAGLVTGTASAQVISVDPMSFDFGDMKQQQQETTFVTVTNEGAALLRILDVKADCGCTVPTLAKDSLAPGESTQIEIQFNSKKFHGNVIKVVNIESNDPINGQVDVMIHANVHTPLVMDPSNQRLGFKRSLKGEVQTRQAKFTAMDVADLQISADKSRQQLFDVKAINNFEGDPQVSVLEVSIPADMPPGRHRDHVRVTTNVEEFPTVDFEIQAYIIQSLTVSPETVSFRYKTQFKQSIRVAPFEKGTDFQITGAEIDLPEISVEVIETIPNEETRVILTGAPIPNTDPRALENKGHIKGTLTIHTDLADTPVLLIPITYMVRL